MPLVQPATLQAVARQLDHHPVAYAQHRGKRGHPVGFAAELYSELVALTGDEGARRLVARYPAFAVELDDPGILVDIDTATTSESARASPPRARRRRRTHRRPARRQGAAGPWAVSRERVAAGEGDQALDVAVADAAVAQRRRGLDQVGERAAVAAVGGAQDLDQLAVGQRAGVARAAPAEREGEAAHRPAACGR